MECRAETADARNPRYARAGSKTPYFVGPSLLTRLVGGHARGAGR